MVSSLVLAIAAFILSVSRKQFILASEARDSTVAFYAADSGIECAIETYENNVNQSGIEFDTSQPIAAVCGPNGQTFSSGTFNGTLNITFNSCHNNNLCNITSDMSFLDDGDLYQTLPLPINLPDGSCFLLVITQGNDSISNQTPPPPKVLMDSRGYNTTCTGAAPKAGPRTLERALRLRYGG